MFFSFNHAFSSTLEEVMMFSRVVPLNKGKLMKNQRSELVTLQIPSVFGSQAVFETSFVCHRISSNYSGSSQSSRVPDAQLYRPLDCMGVQI